MKLRQPIWKKPLPAAWRNWLSFPKMSWWRIATGSSGPCPNLWS